MKILGKKLILGAFVISALTMIGASADQAQAQGPCKGECGGHKMVEGVTPGGHPKLGRAHLKLRFIPVNGTKYHFVSSRCEYFNVLRYFNRGLSKKTEFDRCPNMTLAESVARAVDSANKLMMNSNFK